MAEGILLSLIFILTPGITALSHTMIFIGYHIRIEKFLNIFHTNIK